MINKEGQEAFIHKWGSYSIEQYLTSVGLSRGAIGYIGLMLNMERNLHMALTESIADMTLINDDTEFVHILSGNDRLTNALRDECLTIPDSRCTITYDSRITSVELSNKVPHDVGMEYVSSESSTPIPTRRYDSVIVATTASAAERIQFHNRDLFRDTYRAFRQVHYDCASKIALFFNKTWWTKEQITGGRSTTDLPIRFVYYHNFNPMDNRSRNDDRGGVIIGSYTWSQDSIRWQTLSDDIAFQRVLDDLNTFHQTDSRPYFIGGKTQHWCNDVHTRGAFVFFTPYQEFYVKDTLKRSVGNVHFIGEHTSSAHGWIEGSILSALRAALVIQEEYFDVVIVGGGPVGLATAINLANRNASLRIVVVEQSHVGNSEGSSGSSDTRQFRQMYNEQYLGELAIMATYFWKQLEFDAELTKGTLLNTDEGYLFFGDQEMDVTTEGDLRELERSCRTLSIDCQLMNSTDLRRRYPAFRVPSGHMGIFHPDGGYVNVTALMRTLEKLAKEKNILVRTDEAFLGLDQSVPDTASYVRLFTDRGSLNASKVIFAPGPYARNVSEKLGFILNTTLWELPTIYFQLRRNDVNVPTWFAFGGDKQSLYYGFSLESTDRPGYMKISPDFISDMDHPLIYPNERKYIPDQQLINRTIDWVRENVQIADPESYQVAPRTCLATFLSDNGFLIDYLPNRTRYHEKLIMYAAGWGMKFVPLWADMLAELVLHPNASKYAKYMPHFSFALPNRWAMYETSSNNILNSPLAMKLLILLAIVCIITAIIAVIL